MAQSLIANELRWISCSPGILLLFSKGNYTSWTSGSGANSLKIKYNEGLLTECQLQAIIQVPTDKQNTTVQDVNTEA